VIPQEPFEGAKKGAVMGIALGVVGFLLSLLVWSGLWMAAMPLMSPVYALPSIVFVAELISALIIGAILGGIGGLLSVYVE